MATSASAARDPPAKAGARGRGGMRALPLHAPTNEEVVIVKVDVTFETASKKTPGCILPSLRMDLARRGYVGYFFLDPSRPDFGSGAESSLSDIPVLKLRGTFSLLSRLAINQPTGLSHPPPYGGCEQWRSRHAGSEGRRGIVDR